MKIANKILNRTPKSAEAKPARKGMLARLGGWLRTHKADTAVVTGLLIVSGLVSGLNMANYPQRFEDEGTYVSQAWAVKEEGELAHYTYWYDHPPLAWIQLAGYDLVTGATERYGSAIAAGREFMLVLHLATIVLLYALARRLGLGTLLAGITGLLYALSPLAVEFGRYVLLDNIALPWLLAAFLLALSPRRNLTAVVGSALCLAIAIMSKETFLVFLPAVLYALFQNGDKRNRRFMLTTFLVVFGLSAAFYGLYAALKNELLPGEGHVSLIGTLLWQLSGREGSGSIFDPTSDARGLVGYWLNIDAWLIISGAFATLLALFHRAARPLAAAMLISLALLLRNGYLPYPYIIALLPLAALMIGVTLHRFIAVPLMAANTSSKRRWLTLTKRLAAGTAALAIAATAIVLVAPAWQPGLQALLRDDPDMASRQAVAWVDQNVGRDKRMVVESAIWSDLQAKGFDAPLPVWLYKTETDPEVTREIGDWRGIDYLVLNGPTLSNSTRQEFPTVFEAINHAQVVAEFGNDEHKVVVLKVRK